MLMVKNVRFNYGFDNSFFEESLNKYQEEKNFHLTVSLLFTMLQQNNTIENRPSRGTLKFYFKLVPKEERSEEEEESYSEEDDSNILEASNEDDSPTFKDALDLVSESTIEQMLNKNPYDSDNETYFSIGYKWSKKSLQNVLTIKRNNK